MRVFFRNIILFFALSFVLDFAFGLSCKYLNSHAIGGDTKSNFYIAQECNKELLIFGSSRSVHHYIPEILSDSLGLSVYNCGTDGNGIVLMYSRLLMIIQRYKPKMIIYDLTTAFDFEQGDNVRYLGCLKRFCDIPCVNDVIEKVSPVEKYKLFSNFYRYNGIFMQMAMDNIHPLQTVNDGGFKPLYGVMNYEPKEENNEKYVKWDPLKQEYMNDFINICKDNGIILFFVVSPHYGGYEDSGLVLAEKLSLEFEIPLLYHYNDTNYCFRKELFQDSDHLNITGAMAFTKDIVKEIMKYNN